MELAPFRLLRSLGVRMRSSLSLTLLLVAVAIGSACRPEADVPPGEDIRDLPSAAEPLGGQARDPAAETVAPPREPAASDPAEPATPLRPAPGGSEE